ncbi:DUF192 domain-containing protein [Clostridium caldaquaticum]|uniref:DUF192 domain-containing protein n=1 Tax=Clostridium caldaquaticum TaxID=2940653 RepID=UPI0020777883|nr:DUF192 domain-containing protein [Clostridium caldaquaticum]
MVRSLVYNGEILAEVYIADTFLKRFSGYMFRKKPHYEAILFNPCNSIHTFFMKFSIDVLFLDEQMRVIKKLESLQAGKIIMPIEKAQMVIEGKSGLFKKVELGNKLLVKNNLQEE